MSATTSRVSWASARAPRSGLSLAGGLTLSMEITSYDPPNAAGTFFETNGVKVTSGYVLERSHVGTRLTQTLEAKASGFTAKMLIPIVQGRLETKLAADLEKLRELLGG